MKRLIVIALLLIFASSLVSASQIIFWVRPKKTIDGGAGGAYGVAATGCQYIRIEHHDCYQGCSINNDGKGSSCSVVSKCNPQQYKCCTVSTYSCDTTLLSQVCVLGC